MPTPGQLSRSSQGALETCFRETVTHFVIGIFMPLLYKNTDFSDCSYDSLSFWNQSFLMKSNNSFPQWAYLILPNPTSVEAYFCPHTQSLTKTNFLFCVLICVLRPCLSFDKSSENRSRVCQQVPFFLFFFSSLNWLQNCLSTITACRDSVNKTWTKLLICIKY